MSAVRLLAKIFVRSGVKLAAAAVSFSSINLIAEDFNLDNMSEHVTQGREVKLFTENYTRAIKLDMQRALNF